MSRLSSISPGLSPNIASTTTSTPSNGSSFKDALLAILNVLLIFLFYIFFRRILCKNRGCVHYPNAAAATAAAATPALMPATDGGLSASVLSAIPTFVYTAEERLECTVCLTEFAGGEKGMLLPTCNHGFHAECITMWFLSHSNCPNCRTTVAEQIDLEAIASL